MHATMTLRPGASDSLQSLGNALKGLFSPLIWAITTAMSTSFKKELMTATHNLTAGGHNIRIALFDPTATLDATTTAYATANEVTGTGYTAGGKVLTNVTPTSSGTTAYASFNDVVWTASTFTARGAQLFNNDAANKSIATFDFGSNIPVVAGNFTVTFPTANATAAVLRIA